MARPTVYLETSFISYLTARPSRDIIVARRQVLAREWWETKRQAFDLVVSQTVIEEAELGDPELAAKRIALVADVPLVAANEDSIRLADALMRRMAIPTHVNADAVHIAIAAVNGVNYLLTWNCTHIANAVLRPIIEQACRGQGFEPPVICTPEELLDA